MFLQTKLFINGQFTDSKDGSTIKVLNPHDDSQIADLVKHCAAIHSRVDYSQVKLAVTQFSGLLLFLWWGLNSGDYYSPRSRISDPGIHNEFKF